VSPELSATLAVSAIEPLERALLAEEPVYSARSIARRLFGRRVPWPASTALRYAYGIGLGALASRVPWLRGGLRTALALYGLEIVLLPALGATPPLRRWPRRQWLTLFLHTLAFGLVLRRARATA
jgi:hypothetical protein